MKIAIASGKGGTGKTTLATNLGTVASRQGSDVALLDCDVEEPNCHIFLQPQIRYSCPVAVPVPKVDTEKCTKCGKCVEVCQYNALVCLPTGVLVFAELCHGCGGCELFCPAEAISEEARQVGVVEVGQAKGFRFVQGRLNVGQAMSPPVIKAVRNVISEVGLVIIDAPPGTSCPVISSIRGCDFVILVTEPTPFGLNDLKLAVDMVRTLELPLGVVINRADVGNDEVRLYCSHNDITVLEEIPDDRRIAEAYSRGEMVCEVLPEYESLFAGLLSKIAEEVKIRADRMERTDHEQKRN